jgi:hypothetical protein
MRLKLWEAVASNAGFVFTFRDRHRELVSMGGKRERV